MEFHQLKCPNCGSTLDMEDGLNIFYCKYCGTKIIVNGQSDATVQARTNIRLAEKELEKHKLDLEYEQRKTEQIHKNEKFIFIVMICLVIFFLLLLFIPD